MRWWPASPELAEAHPYQPEKVSQGALRIMKTLSACLIEITGMDAITLQPAAGAHGELTGILMVRAYLESQGQPAQEDPDPRFRARHQSRHRRHCGLRLRALQSNAAGTLDLAALEAQLNRGCGGAHADQPQHPGSL
jgi:glycine dehydrogenase subunit 2